MGHNDCKNHCNELHDHSLKGVSLKSKHTIHELPIPGVLYSLDHHEQHVFSLMKLFSAVANIVTHGDFVLDLGPQTLKLLRVEVGHLYYVC